MELSGIENNGAGQEFHCYSGQKRNDFVEIKPKVPICYETSSIFHLPQVALGVFFSGIPVGNCEQKIQEHNSYNQQYCGC